MYSASAIGSADSASNQFQDRFRRQQLIIAGALDGPQSRDEPGKRRLTVVEAIIP
jgi:hypothetical protein